MLPNMPLIRGTWLRTLVPLMDEGDHGERHARAGAVGVVTQVERSEDIEGEYKYHVVFHPSGVWNVFYTAEIVEDCEVLPSDSPDIPSLEERRLADAILEIYYSGGADEDERTVTIDMALSDRLLQAGKAASEEIEAAIRDLLTPDGAPLPFSKVDALAELVGVGDRYGAEAPAPAP